MNKINTFITLILVACAIGSVSLAIVSAKKYEDVCAELTHQIGLKEHYKDDCLKLMRELAEVQNDDQQNTDIPCIADID